MTSDSAQLVNNKYLNITSSTVWGLSSSIVNNNILRISNRTTTSLLSLAQNEAYGYPPILHNSDAAKLFVAVSKTATVAWVFKNYGAVQVTGGKLHNSHA